MVNRSANEIVRRVVQGSRFHLLQSAGLMILIAAIGVVMGCNSENSPAEKPAQDAAAGFSADLTSELQQALDDWAEETGHRGVSAAVILKSGQEWVSTAGVESAAEPLLPEHLIWIASITKTMTGAVILQLAEEGRLSLDDTISKWLPEIENISGEITLRQLLNHTNGLANYTSSAGLNDAIGADRENVFTADELLSFVGPSRFSPGERTEYTNTAFVLLGKIAEAVTGQSMVELYRHRLWDPLQLSEIYLPGYGAPPGPVATAWAGGLAEQEALISENVSLVTIGNAAFGLFSNARIVARWGRALFTGKVFGDEMREEMLQFVPAAGNIRGESGAGLGIRKYDYLGREQWGHSGGSPLGSSLLLFDPDTGVTVAVLMNQGRNAHHFLLAPELLRLATEQD